MSTISASTTSTTAFKITTDTTGALVFQTGASPTTAMTLGSDQSVTFAGTPTYSGGTANGVAYLNASKVLTTGTVLVFDGSNLGIGTTSPSAQLHLYKNAASASQMTIENASSSAGSYATVQFNAGTVTSQLFSDAAGGVYAAGAVLRTTSNHPLIFGTNSTERGRFDASGNLGIGTTSPTAKLHVQGNSSISTSDWYASSATIRAQATSGNNTQAAIVLMSRGPTGSPAGASIHSQPAGSDNYRAGLVNTITGDGTGQAYWSVNNFNPTTASTSELCRVTYDGNLLVGTTTAVEKITVTSGSIRTTSDNSCIVNGNDANLGFVKKAGFDGHLVASSASPMIFSRLNQTTITSATVAAGTLSEFARFDTSGQFIIGGTSANAKLDVYSTTADQKMTVFTRLPGDQNFQLGFKNGVSTNTAGSSFGRLSGWYGGTELAYIGMTRSGGAQCQDIQVVCGSAGVYITNGGTSWSSLSDERQKTDLTPIENAAAKVATLRTVTGRYLTDKPETRRAFLIAQDVQAVLPEAVNVQVDEDQTLGLQYTDVIPLLAAAVKELKARIETLEAA